MNTDRAKGSDPPTPEADGRYTTAEDFEQFLADFAADLASIGDLSSFCSFVSKTAQGLVGADEALVYLETRPLSPGDGQLQLTMPLRCGHKELGLLSVRRHAPAAGAANVTPFNAQDDRRLHLLANVAALALANLKRERGTRQRTAWRARALELLHETVRTMSSTLETAPLIRRILRATVRALDAQVGLLALQDSTGHLVVHAVHAVEGDVPAELNGAPITLEQGLMGWAMRHRRAVLVVDPSADPRVSPEHILLQAGLSLDTLLAAPLVTKGQTIGAIEIANRCSGAFDQGDLQLLEITAFAAAAAIENVRLYERLTRQMVQQENVIRVSQATSSAQNIDTILQEVVEATLSSIPHAFTTAIHLVDEATGVLRLRSYGGRPLWNTMEQPFSVGQGIAGRAFGTLQVVNVPDVLNAPDYIPGPGPAVYRSLLVAPLIVEGQPLGTLSVNGLEPGAFSVEDEQTIYALAAQTAVVLRNARLYAQAEERAQELELANRQLQNLARLKNQFVQNTSHELRTPLTLVRAYLELLMAEEFGPLPEQQLPVIEILNRRIEQLVELVNDIASLVELELNLEELDQVDLVDIVTAAVTTQWEQFQQAGIRVKTELPGTLALVKGSAGRLGQVFHHLLENAIKFSPAGGEVEVRVWYEHGHVFARVADEGIGVPPEEQPYIFDRFYQVDGSTTRRFGGTGLGLAIVKEMVEAHGGKVQIESSGVEGEGAAFTVILPRIKEQSQ